MQVPCCFTVAQVHGTQREAITGGLCRSFIIDKCRVRGKSSGLFHLLPHNRYRMFPYKTFPVAPAKTPLKITVIGHHGRMGAMLSELWRRAGHDVRGIDRPAAPVEVGAGSVVAPVPSAGG